MEEEESEGKVEVLGEMKSEFRFGFVDWFTGSKGRDSDELWVNREPEKKGGAVSEMRRLARASRRPRAIAGRRGPRPYMAL